MQAVKVFCCFKKVWFNILIIYDCFIRCVPVIEQKCTNEDFDMVQRGIQLVKEEVENEVERRDSQLEYNEVQY